MNENFTKIALVDDHPIVAIGVKAMLEKDPQKKLVYHAYCGEEILQFLAQYPIDLLLLDLNLPDYECLDLIRAVQSIAPSMKIVAYTAYDDPSLMKCVLRLGVDGYLLKTTPPERFRNALHKVLTCEEVYIGASIHVEEKKQTQEKKLKDDFQKRLSLSKREKEILSLISQGYTSSTISQALYISKYTVETHRKNILRKLNFSSSTELVKFAVQQGLV
jgi:DNA-binding NarL/FixJ family response regulator